MDILLLIFTYQLNLLSSYINIFTIVSGIGRQVCKALVQCDADVIALSRTKSYLDSLSQEVKLTTVCIDLSDWNVTREKVKSLLPIDGLVNNAAIALLEPFLNAQPDSFDR